MMGRVRMQVASLMALAAGLDANAGLPTPVYTASTASHRYSVDEIVDAERRRAERERDEWNRNVDRKKAERNARRGR